MSGSPLNDADGFLMRSLSQLTWTMDSSVTGSLEAQ
jgi:hypothetical protein